jgi:hypothetical protein
MFLKIYIEINDLMLYVAAKIQIAFPEHTG